MVSTDSRRSTLVGIAALAAIALLSWGHRAHRKQQLSIFCWNILAPIWIYYPKYTHIEGDLNLLHPNKRLLLVIERILQSDADIVTLQEVQADQYQVILSELAHKYESLGHTHHVLSYWTDEWLVEGETPMENGPVTFVRKDKFKLLYQKTIQTTDDGNRLQIVVLRFASIFRIFESSRSDFILVNLHLEAGIKDERKHFIRQQQVIQIRKEIEAVKNELAKSANSNPSVIIIGDFNTNGYLPGMKEVRNQGFVDVAEMLHYDKPTGIGNTSNRTFDHVALLNTDIIAGRISAKKIFVPDVDSSEYDARHHKETILNALYGRLKRRGMSLKDALEDPETFDIITHIAPSREHFEDRAVLRSLRVGSDHLPLYVELEL